MISRAFLSAVLLLPIGLQPLGELRVEPDQQNVTSDRLFGRWEWDPLVGERMGLKERATTLEFAADDSFLDQIPDAFVGKLQELPFYESGVVTMREGGKVTVSAPYLLTVIHGNPHLLWFRERNGVPLGDIESANVFVAPGEDAAGDLLLLGGDFDNQPFRPFRRVREGE